MNRIDWIDYTKGILIFLVVLGHIMPLGSIDSGWCDVNSYVGAFRMWIYACHIPAFFIVNGLLKGYKGYLDKVDSIAVVIRKQRKTFLYYFIFSFIFLIRYFLQYLIGQITIEELWMFVYNTICLIGMGALWFIPTFIISDLLFYVIMRGGKNFKVLYTFIVILFAFSTFIVQFHGLDTTGSIMTKLAGLCVRCIVGSTFIFIGFVLSKYDLRRSNVFTLFGLLSILAFLNGNVDMNNLFFHNIILYIIFAITGTFLIIKISMALSMYNCSILRIIKVWGGVFFVHNVYTYNPLYYTWFKLCVSKDSFIHEYEGIYRLCDSNDNRNNSNLYYKEISN